jgi:7-carboxy-7-deazaguanine synthase
MDTLAISELFKSVAGEGMDMGMPTTYVRLFGCNMNPPCPFCDTMFSVKKIDDTIRTLTLEQIVEEIKKLNCKRVAFTGGEPFLFIDKIQKIIFALGSTYSFHFETNGKIYTEVLTADDSFFDISVSVSPKLHAITDEYIGTLVSWTDSLDYTVFLKFVYENQDTVRKIKELQERMKNNFGIAPVYLMPEGRGINKKLYQECYKVCIDNNWRLSPRLQCIVWDDARGT